MEKHTERIQQLNDQLRTQFDQKLGQIIMTHGVSELKEYTKFKVFQAVQAFDEFTPENDPYAEHDFGQVEVDSEKYYFKIDYYDPTMLYLSDDPSDPDKTKRVLTIMQAREY